MPLGFHKATLFGVAGVSTGDVVLLSSQTASDSASISFTSGINSTYGEYIFKVYNVNPVTNQEHFTFQGSTDGGSNYNVAITSTHFRARNSESGADPALAYEVNYDQAQGTDFQILAGYLGDGADEDASGTLSLFNPSSTTYVKHWIGHFSGTNGADNNYEIDDYPAGYFNTTSAINAIQFKMSSGNFDGKIKMWGVK